MEKKNEKVELNKLLINISKGKRLALENFYNAYGKLIYTSALAVSKSVEIANEVVDDILFKIWANAKTYISINNPSGWLYILTVNCAKDKLKSDKSFSELFDVDSTVSIDGEIDDNSFYNLIENLNESEKQVLILRFINDLSFKQIAKEIKKSIGTVTSTYYRALEKIKNNKLK